MIDGSTPPPSRDDQHSVLANWETRQIGTIDRKIHLLHQAKLLSKRYAEALRQLRELSRLDIFDATDRYYDDDTIDDTSRAWERVKHIPFILALRKHSERSSISRAGCPHVVYILHKDDIIAYDEGKEIHPNQLRGKAVFIFDLLEHAGFDPQFMRFNDCALPDSSDGMKLAIAV